MAEFRMPSLGADMESGTLLEWRVKPGDTVKRGDIVAVVDTSKAEIEVEIFQDGTVEELLVPAGARVPVGTVLARLLAPGESVPGEPAPGKPAPSEPAGPPTPTPPSAKPAPAAAEVTEASIVSGSQPAPGEPSPNEPTGTAGRLRVSPVARRAAERLGVDIATVHGSGPGGAITMSDVERTAAGPSAAGAAPGPAPASPDRQAAMRNAIGALMARSKREIPHYYLQSTIDVSVALQWLGNANETRPMSERLLPAALLLAAVARAAKAMHAMNGFWSDEAFRPSKAVHLGVAVSLRGGGLIAPAIHDADRKSVEELMSGVRDLVRRARTGVLRSSEMSDPTITVTNLGDLGAEAVHGVIYPPQVALVGFGAIRERPWAQDGMLGVRPVVTATLAGDHRASDGADGSRFLALVERHLQRPGELSQ